MASRTPGFLLTALRNLAAKRINRELIGYRIEESIPPIDLQSAIEFAGATRDTRPPSQSDPFVPPFYAARIVFPLFSRVATHRNLKLNLLRAVHGEMTMRWYHPLRIGDSPRVDVEITAVDDTPVGELLRLSGRLFREDDLCIEAHIGMLVRSRKHGGKKDRSTGDEPAVRFETPLITSEGQQLEYARASGDHNFIHTSEILARLAGLPRTILHGMCVMAMSHNALVAELSHGDPSRVRSMTVRFSRPVLPGQSLRLVAYRSAESEAVPFAVFNPSGKPVITHGVFRLQQDKKETSHV